MSILKSSIDTCTDYHSIYANKGQKFFTYAGYYGNEPARALGRSIEYLTRPMLQGNSYWTEVGERVKKAVAAIFSLPLAAALFIPSFTCYTIGAYVGKGRFEYIQPQEEKSFWQEKSVKVMSVNACLQDPWSALTGGVVTPFEPTAHSASRVAAIVHAIVKEDPVVFMGQEFDNIGAQDESIRLLKQNGYSYFLRDLGANDPTSNSSGLFVASKMPLKNIEFKSYPLEDRFGLAKWSNQGALTFTVHAGEKDLRLINVHLNYGDGPDNQAARNRQLTRHVVPLLERGDAVLFGDLNFNTGKVDRIASGLFGFVNALEGQVTCTDAGKHSLRGKSLHPNGKPCTDCEESIDGLIYNPKKIQVLKLEAKPLTWENQLLSDHYVTTSVLEISDL